MLSPELHSGLLKLKPSRGSLAAAVMALAILKRKKLPQLSAGQFFQSSNSNLDLSVTVHSF
jgi:hypothetical protein